MKTASIRTVATAMAMGMITGLQASVIEHQPPAPLPEFKTPEQLAKWRSETTARAEAQQASRPSTLDSSTPFYTGKPYLAESRSYAFKYRQYSPEMGRWTTVDPSGFPDGANNRVYAAVPTSELDANGLYTDQDRMNDAYTVGLAIGAFDEAGFSMSSRRASHSMGFMGDEGAPSSEISALKNSSYFTNIFNKSYFKRLAGTFQENYMPTYNTNEVVIYTGINDLHYSYGKVGYNVSGYFTWVDKRWMTEATFTFADAYDFAWSWNPAINAFKRLQDNKYAQIYTTTGSFNLTFSE